MNATIRRLWGLAAVGGAVAVGITTRDAGFTFLTLAGGLWLPRILGLSGGHRFWHGACAGRDAGRRHLEDRMADWHSRAHGDATVPPATASV